MPSPTPTSHHPFSTSYPTPSLTPKTISISIPGSAFCLSLAFLASETTSPSQKQEVADADLSSPLCGVWQWEEAMHEPSEESEIPYEALAGEQVNRVGL